MLYIFLSIKESRHLTDIISWLLIQYHVFFYKGNIKVKQKIDIFLKKIIKIFLESKYISYS